jgi:hypothetical protein
MAEDPWADFQATLEQQTSQGKDPDPFEDPPPHRSEAPAVGDLDEAGDAGVPGGDATEPDPNSGPEATGMVGGANSADTRTGGTSDRVGSDVGNGNVTGSSSGYPAPSLAPSPRPPQSEPSSGSQAAPPPAGYMSEATVRELLRTLAAFAPAAGNPDAASFRDDVAANRRRIESQQQQEAIRARQEEIEARVAEISEASNQIHSELEELKRRREELEERNQAIGDEIARLNEEHRDLADQESALSHLPSLHGGRATAEPRERDGSEDPTRVPAGDDHDPNPDANPDDSERPYSVTELRVLIKEGRTPDPDRVTERVARRADPSGEFWNRFLRWRQWHQENPGMKGRIGSVLGQKPRLYP